MDREKMHIWGANRAQRVIFKDEYERYHENGWRDHPNKVGVEPEAPEIIEAPTPKMEGESFKIDVVEEAPKKRGKRAK